ncbi:MAG: class I SAM-dependent methyltransferase [Gammaproteobacteria bacterium]|nr:class I SAM-dependent methyltransferase [Gammaproteobacteria bacterium]
MQTSELEQHKHAILPEPTHDELARQQFVRSFKEHLVAHVHPGNRLAYEHRVKPAFVEENGREPDNRFEIRDVMIRDPHYRLFSALLRTSQEMMWSASQQPVQRNLHDLAEKAKDADSAGGSLRLDPDLEIPRYHKAVDIHCQPGGYHTEVTRDDVAPGAVYDRAVFIYAMGQMGPDNADMGDSAAAWIKENYPDFKPARILDMGCAVGHSTVPYAQTWPDAEVHGIDVAAPMLRYAHARAESLGAKVHFSQQNAERTDFEDASFDLVVSHILLHETSEKAIRRVISECHRLLKPGGLMVHAETPPYKDLGPFDAFMLDWDTRNNNEPFWGRSHDIDYVELSSRAGFDPEKVFEVMAPSAYQIAQARRSKVFQGGDFGGGGLWFLYGAEKQAS